MTEGEAETRRTSDRIHVPVPHARIAVRHNLPFALVADTDLRIDRLSDVVRFGGLRVKRVTGVIDRRTIARELLHNEILINAHGRHTIEMLKQLNGTSP